MGASKSPVPQDTSSDVLSKVRDGRIAKPQKPVTPLQYPDPIELAIAPEAASSKHANEDHGQFEDIEVYMVMVEHRVQYLDDDNEILKLCPNLGEANDEARRYLQEHEDYGPEIEWDEYQEKIAAAGTMRIEASGLEGETFEIRVEKKMMKRKTRSNHAATEVKPTDEPLEYVYIVKVESRKNVCGSNEEGEIDSVEIASTCKNPEDANNFLRSLAEERMEEGFECDEDEIDGLLHMSVLDMMEGEKVVYYVEKQRVW